MSNSCCRSVTKDSGFLSDILISGNSDRNRAVHGDSVVVELYPKSLWKGRSLAITESQPTEGNVHGVCGTDLNNKF